MAGIKAQQLIAQRLLIALEEASGIRAAMVRGGAPRSWFHNAPANDIDIFVEVHKGFASREYWETYIRSSLGQSYQRFIYKNQEQAQKLYRLGDSYRADFDVYSGGDPDIISVLEGFYDDQWQQKVQIVIVNTDEGAHYNYFNFNNRFPTDFSKIAFNKLGDMIVSEEFLNCHRNQSIIYDDHEMSTEYLAKLMHQYPTYSAVSKHTRIGHLATTM